MNSNYKVLKYESGQTKEIKDLEKKGATLSATEQPISTKDATSKCFLDMLSVFSEFETNLRKERQMEGIAKAKEKGVYKGRKAGSNEDILTISPDTKVFEICAKTPSTKSEDSLRERPISRTKDSPNSNLVSVFPVILFPLYCVSILSEIFNNGQQKMRV